MHAVPVHAEHLFTPEDRTASTTRVVAALKAGAGVEEVVRIGSIADGTADRHSDVDLVVVLAPDAEVATVAEAGTRTVLATLPVFHHFADRLGAVEVRGFLLESFLELDVGFARRGDVAGAIAVPGFDAAAKLDFCWHDVIHAAVALDRGRPWRALWYVERLRNGALELAADRLGLDLRHFKAADDLPPETLAAAAAAMPAGRSVAELWTALRAATSAVFAEGRRTRPELADKLEPKLVRFLDVLEGDRAS